MKTAGIICEYNPFHLGHGYQLAQIREKLGENTHILCLMSGNFVQRGEPAILEKYTRAAAAARCGADLVAELPFCGALSSAEGFARVGVETLARLGVCDVLAFGSESGGTEPLAAAEAMAHPQFEPRLRDAVSAGAPYAAAKQKVLSELTGIPGILAKPNDILAAEYCRFLRDTGIEPLPILRRGDDRSITPNGLGSSAGAVRAQMLCGGDWKMLVPHRVQTLYETAAKHTRSGGERAVLAALYRMTEADWLNAAHNSEGLHNRILRALQDGASLSDIAAEAKSKRYPASRISRLLLCAALGITRDDLLQPIPYVRILAFGAQGRQLAREIRKKGTIPLLNPTENAPRCAYSETEARLERFYRLFEL